MTADRFVTVARRDSLGAANLAKALLEEADIPCLLANTDQSGLGTMFDPSQNGIHVRVPEDRVTEARSVLEMKE